MLYWLGMGAVVRTRPALALVAAVLLAGAACSGGSNEAVEVGDGADAAPTPTPLRDDTAPAEPTTDPVDATQETEPPDPADDAGGIELDLVDGEPGAFTGRSKLSTVGIDEVFFGMAVDLAAEAASTEWAGAPSPLTSCYFVQPGNGPDGISFMVWDGFVERVDITNPILTTRSGAGVGSTEDQLRDLFGAQLESVSPTTLAFVPTDEADAEFRIYFEIDGGEVTSLKAGRLAQVELESCPADE